MDAFCQQRSKCVSWLYLIFNSKLHLNMALSCKANHLQSSSSERKFCGTLARSMNLTLQSPSAHHKAYVLQTCWPALSDARSGFSLIGTLNLKHLDFWGIKYSQKEALLKDGILSLQTHPEEFIIKVEGRVVVGMMFKKSSLNTTQFYMLCKWSLEVITFFRYCFFLLSLLDFFSCIYLKPAGDCASVTHRHSSVCVIGRAEWLVDV